MLALVLYIATIAGANWAIEQFGMVPVGFGLQAPAGVYFAGLAFTFRDLVHDRFGARGALMAILLGSAVSFVVAPAFAVASMVAFLLSECADLLVYAPLRERRRLVGIAVSNLVGGVLDSTVFLWLAFGSLDHLLGQVIGKWWMTVLAVILLAIGRRRHDLALGRRPRRLA